MHGYKRRLTVAAALGVGLAALTGSALAAPPSEPPGQEKKAEQAATPAQPAVPPGQAKKAEQPTAKTHGVNATTEGTKPSSTTKKNTKTTAGARPDVSKRYGNGKTAAQIATSRGAPGSTEIRSPGNSQPHKVCRNGHWVDVHAVKSYSANTCSSSSSTSSSTAAAAAGVAPQTAAAAAASSPAASSSAPASGGVLGAEHTAGPAGSAEPGGVAGAFAEIGGVAAGTLPFTGFPLWAAVLVAIAAIAIGISLWRRGRPAQTSDIV
jgi:hypothetical protein